MSKDQELAKRLLKGKEVFKGKYVERYKVSTGSLQLDIATEGGIGAGAGEGEGVGLGNGGPVIWRASRIRFLGGWRPSPSLPTWKSRRMAAILRSIGAPPARARINHHTPTFMGPATAPYMI